MSKLYPPYIEGTIPAFYTDNEKGTVLTVPFSMNKTVSKNLVSGFKAKIKTVQSGTFLASLSSSNFDIDEQYIEFKLTSEQVKKFNIGQYYKVQVAYESNGEEGYFSTVGVTKYTTKPEVTIKNLNSNEINFYQNSYTGCYSQSGDDKDSSEKEYSYQFILYDSKNNVVADSGILLHNNSNDTSSYESYDTYSFPFSVTDNKSYYLVYKVTTINNMEVSSSRYRVMQKQFITPTIKASLSAKMNFDNGYIDVKLVGDKDKNGKEYSTTGKFLLTRACEDDDYTQWDEILKFSLYGQTPSRDLWKDFTVVQGKNYVYALQQYNESNIYSTRILSNEIMADFEDIFLYDGERQLKVRYNPKVTSFKTDYLETKVDTIGSQFPFIFRNGSVAYKEFPISGLFSYFSDADNLFMTDDELGLDSELNNITRRGKTPTAQEMAEAKVRTINLTGYNVSAERNFKLAAMDWLNNGEPKLFRSPGEGNYIIRIINVSLAPEEKINRMLHTFSGTAYEVAECSYENLVDLGIVKVEEIESKEQYYEATVNLGASTMTLKVWDNNLQDFSSIYEDKKIDITGELLDGITALNTTFTNMLPQSIVIIRQVGQADQSIMIGSTGNYKVDTDIELESIRPSSYAKYQGVITYNYYSNEEVNALDNINNLTIIEIPARQFIGKQNNIVEQIKDVKTTIAKFYYLHFSKRPIQECYEYGGNYYEDSEHTTLLSYSLPLYSYTKDAFWINGWRFVGMREVKDLSASDFANGTYYYLTSYLFKEEDTYNSTRTYYKKEPFVFYYDLNRPGEEIISADSYERVKFLTDIINDESFDGNTGTALLSTLTKYSTEIVIDGDVVNLDDKEEYNIDSMRLCDDITIDNGVILNCGYQIQSIEYIIEQMSNDSEFKKLKTEYNNLIKYLSSDTMKANCFPYGNSDSTESQYVEDLEYAIRLYNDTYESYVNYVDYLLDQEAESK